MRLILLLLVAFLHHGAANDSTCTIAACLACSTSCLHSQQSQQHESPPAACLELSMACWAAWEVPAVASLAQCWT